MGAFVTLTFSPHLHKGVAVKSERSTCHLLEALADVGQWARPQDLRLLVEDESQGNSEKNLGALVEKAIPDPQNSLEARETWRIPVRWSTWDPGLDSGVKGTVILPLLEGCRCKGRWTSVTPPVSICQDTGPWAVPLQGLWSSPAPQGPPDPSLVPTWPGYSSLKHSRTFRLPFIFYQFFISKIRL